MPKPGSRSRPLATSAPSNSATADTTRKVRRTDSMSSNAIAPPSTPPSSRPASTYELTRPSW
jgi:hypothetical protein